MPATFRNNIRIVPAGFEDTIANLKKINPALREAIRKTVDKTIPFAESELVRLITDRYDITKANLIDQSRRQGKTVIKVIRPQGTNKVEGGLKITGTRFPVMRFRVDPTSVPAQRGIPVQARQVVTVSVRKGNPQVGRKNVFLARMKSGHIGIFKKKPDSTHFIRPDGQRTQLNITEEFMLSVPEMLSSKPLRKPYEDNLEKFFMKTFMEETKGRGFKFKGWFWGLF